jgi:hypothetical protein
MYKKVYEATLLDTDDNVVEQRTFEIAEHAAQWAAQYLATMAEDGKSARAAVDVIERFEADHAAERA